MVCHESYKDEKGNWLYPDQVERIDSKTVIKKSDKDKSISWCSRVNVKIKKKYY